MREGENVSLGVSGTGGSKIFVLQSRTPLYAWNPANEGPLGLRTVSPSTDLPQAILGPLPASGSAVYSLTTPPLPAGAEHDTIYMQVVSADPGTGQILLGTPHALVIVDASF